MSSSLSRSRSYRGMAIVWRLTQDQLLVPAVIVLAIFGAVLIGTQIHAIVSPEPALPSYQL